MIGHSSRTGKLMGVDHRWNVHAARWLVAAVALTAFVGVSAAQVPQPKAQPKAAPKAAQPAAPAEPSAGELALNYSPWTKLCGKENQAGAKEVCLTVKEARLDSGEFIASAALIEPAGEPKKILRIMVPLGMQIAVGTRMLVDRGQASVGQYLACFPNGCMADFEVNAGFVGQLKSGKTLWLQTINLGGQPANYPLPLADFAKANEGPASDPKVLEAQQQKLEQELKRKAEEARGKLGNQPAPAR
jgi:invasion protein IalB